MKRGLEENTRLQFELFCNEYLSFIYYGAGRYIQRSEAREDCVQTVLLRLLEHADSFLQLPKEKKHAYIMTAIRNYAIDQNRKDPSCPLEEVGEDLASVDDFTIKLLEREQHRLLYKCISQIKDTDRSVIEMYYFYGYDNDVISEKLHISPKSVRTCLCRTRKALKQKLEESGYKRC